MFNKIIYNIRTILKLKVNKLKIVYCFKSNYYYM